MPTHTFRQTVVYTGPREALLDVSAGYHVSTVGPDKHGVTRHHLAPSKVRTLPDPDAPPKRPANYTTFRLAGALSALSTLASTRLPDPRDDADLREALALLGGIERRRRERNESNMEKPK